jgi:hypothetical protein
VSGEKKWKKARDWLTAVSTLRVWPRFFSVLCLSVALTTGRSGIRKDHLHALLTLSHHNGDDGTESKKSQADCQVDGTGEPSIGEEKLTRRTRDGKEDEKEQ